MARRFSRKTSKRTRIRLSPKEAEDIVKSEFTDSHGGKHNFRLRFRPQNPLEPDFKQTIEYKDKDNNND